MNKKFEPFLDSLNIEFVCSFCDLLIKHYFIPEAKGVSLQGCPIPFIHHFHKEELQSALNFINHHMLDLLLEENLEIEEKTFDKMAGFFKEGDKFISFNYDLIIEQMLWKRELWNPFEGYGFQFENPGNEKYQNSKTQVIKIHGSINWRKPDILFHPNLELAIDHPFEDKPLFDGLNIEKSIYDKVKYRQYPLYSHIILPTFMKTPQFNWEISLINDSLKYCKEAEEIYILGYSVPDADYISNLLFSEMNKNAKIYIVLWDNNAYPNPAEDLRDKLIERYGFNKDNITHEHSKIEDWINNNYKYIEYKKFLETEELFYEMKRVSDESNDD